MKKLAVGALILFLLPLFIIFLAVGSSACTPNAAQAASVSVDPDALPVDRVGSYNKKALTNAAVIMNIAQQEGLPQKAQLIGVMTAIGESTLGTNPGTEKPNGDGDAGLFQQRQYDGWYGNLEQVNDPVYASKAFFNGVTAKKKGDYGSVGGGKGFGHIPGLKDIKGWEDMEPTLAANRVQRNADPYHYAKFESDAKKIIEALGNVEVLTNDSQPAEAGGDITGDPASGAEGTDIYNKLKKSLGPVKPHVLSATSVIAAATGHKPGDIGGYRSSGSRDPNGHPAGLAVDFMVPLTDEGEKQGDRIAEYIIGNYKELNVKYVIWRQRIWNPSRSDKWRQMEDRGSPTQNHMDHPHVSFTAESPGNPQEAKNAPRLPSGAGADTDADPECESPQAGGDVQPTGEKKPGHWGYPNGQIPKDKLAVIPWAKHESLRADATAALVKMNNEFKKEFGTDLGITDAYRPLSEQEYLYKIKPPGMAATPGKSNHGWGLAVDFGTGINRFGTPQHEWMKKNAGRFGWKHPEWARQGQPNAEAWHWEFWGVKK